MTRSKGKELFILDGRVCLGVYMWCAVVQLGVLRLGGTYVAHCQHGPIEEQYYAADEEEAAWQNRGLGRPSEWSGGVAMRTYHQSSRLCLSLLHEFVSFTSEVHCAKGGGGRTLHVCEPHGRHLGEENGLEGATGIEKKARKWCGKLE